MTAKAPQIPPQGVTRPPAPAAPPRVIIRKTLSQTERIEALEAMLRQEKSNALYWHDKFVATLPTSEPQREREKGLSKTLIAGLSFMLGVLIMILLQHG